jgi:serine/threonine-protein kinase RsbW
VPASPPELTFTGPAGPECLDAIHHLLDRLWDAETGADDTDRAMFTTAVLEVASNVVAHNSPDSSVSLSLFLSADSGMLRAELRENGSPAAVDIATASLPDDFAESGRGLALARMALDDFRYERAEELNRWQLARRIADSAR